MNWKERMFSLGIALAFVYLITSLMTNGIQPGIDELLKLVPESAFLKLALTYAIYFVLSLIALFLGLFKIKNRFISTGLVAGGVFNLIYYSVTGAVPTFGSDPLIGNIYTCFMVAAFIALLLLCWLRFKGEEAPKKEPSFEKKWSTPKSLTVAKKPVAAK